MKAFYLVVVIAALIATFVAVDAFNNNNDRGCLNAYDHIDVIIAEGCDQ